MKRILIASCSDDQSVHLVARELRARGHRPIVYDIGRVYAASTAFETVVDKDGRVSLRYGKHSFRPDKRVIVKMPYAVLQNDGESDKMLFTTILQNERTKLPTDALPFPAIWQPYKQKAREWRVTVVGGQLFAASIYTSKDSKHDWREYSHDKSKVRFCAEEFPKGEKRKCFNLLKALGLRYGAFDFIETPDGEIVFLEVNPNGQYGWLEEELGFSISAAIATELIDISLGTATRP